MKLAICKTCMKERCHHSEQYYKKYGIVQICKKCRKKLFDSTFVNPMEFKW
jgi:hypothetical protein